MCAKLMSLNWTILHASLLLILYPCTSKNCEFKLTLINLKFYIYAFNFLLQYIYNIRSYYEKRRRNKNIERQNKKR